MSKQNATEPFYRSPNNRDDQRTGSWDADGRGVSQTCLRPASFYKFKAKYGGMNVSDTHSLKSLEDENAKLKRLLADTMLDNVVLKDLLGKN